MGAQVSNNPNIVLSNPNEEIIEYQGYEDFAIVEIAKNDLLKQEKLKPNPSLNNHSGGSSIGKYESEHNLHKCKEKNREENKNEDLTLKIFLKKTHNKTIYSDNILTELFHIMSNKKDTLKYNEFISYYSNPVIIIN